MTADAPSRLDELLKRLNHVTERLERATDQAIARSDRRQRERDDLARANGKLLAARQAIASDLDDVVARLRALLEEG